MLARLADKLVLQPSRYAIQTAGKRRHVIPMDNGQIEIWSQRTPTDSDRESTEPDLFILKFSGTGGRAERATKHPADYWDDCRTEVWAVNPPGYGGSTGRASLRMMGSMARAAYSALTRRAGSRPIVVTGNSLGAIFALHVAAQYEIDGLLLRNPPPLRELIMGRHAWWTLGVGAWSIARQVPTELCSIRNAAASKAPTLFVMSGQDRVVPPRYQHRIIESHAGENRVLLLPRADHASLLDAEEQIAYGQLLTWLRERTWQRHRERMAADSSMQKSKPCS